MAAMQVRALYDFEAATEAELTFKVNDVMLVTRTDVGGGWWEGERDGVLGLFPLHYVQVLDGPVSAPDDGDTSGSEGADSISSKDSLSSGASATRLSTAFSGARRPPMWTSRTRGH